MDFLYTEEQAMMRESVARYLRDGHGFDKRADRLSDPDKLAAQVMAELTELGLTALLVPEAHGGLGGSVCDFHGVLREMGAALYVSPLSTSSIVATGAILASGVTRIQEAYLPRLAVGSVLLGCALDHSVTSAPTSAKLEGGRWRLSGEKHNVLFGPQAVAYVVLAEVESADADPVPGLFLVDRQGQGGEVSVSETYRLVDGSPAASVRFSNAMGEALFDLDVPESRARAVDSVIRLGIAVACAEGLGAAEGAIAMTAEYVGSRRQFGKNLAENQAVRHRVAEMLVNLESIKSMSMLATIACDQPSSTLADDHSRAKILLGVHGRKIVEDAIQLHGGIGMTEEYRVGHYLQRFQVLDHAFGDSDWHAHRLGSKIGVSE